jgi:hypothetical protein
VADTPSVLIVKDGQSPQSQQNIGVMVDSSGTKYHQEYIRFDGGVAGAANPFPVTDAAAETALTSAVALLTTIAGSSGGGGSTAALQTTGNTTLGSILTALGSTATTALQTAGNALLTAISGYLGTLAGAVSSGRVLTADGNMTPCGFLQAPVSTVQSLTALAGGAIPSGARIVWILPEGAGVRWRDDGTAPTAIVGMPIVAGQAWPYEGSLSALQLVSQGGTSTVNLWFVG